MCGRFSNTGSRADVREKLAERLGISTPDTDRGFERFNIAPSQEVLAVVEDRAGRRIETLRWGLIPSWAKEAKVGFKMINARAETVLERPSYRSLVKRAKHRCLVVADGWYEWQKPEDPEQPRRPVHFSLDDGSPFCFAGLWTTWKSPAGELLPTCTIVTCEANDVTRPIHDRMPVVLPERTDWEAWLNPSLDGHAACELLAPLDPDRVSVRPANPVVNSGRHEGPDCLVVASV